MYTWGGVSGSCTSSSCSSSGLNISNNGARNTIPITANAMLGRGDCVKDSPIPAVVEMRKDTCQTLRGMKMKSERMEQVSCGKSHCAALSSSGILYTWGSDDAMCGVLGVSGRKRFAAPSIAENGEEKESHEQHRSQRTSRECTQIHEIVQWTPRQVHIHDMLATSMITPSKSVVYVDCGKFSTAAITSDGCLYTWGSGAMGILGHGDRSDPR